MVITKEKMKALPEWGTTLSLDLHECEAQKIRDKNYIVQYVSALCRLIRVRRFGVAQVVRFGRSPRIAGYSLVQLIESSLVSGHFVEVSNSAYIDIFSCKKYDQGEATRFTVDFFGAKHYNVHTISRR